MSGGGYPHRNPQNSQPYFHPASPPNYSFPHQQGNNGGYSNDPSPFSFSQGNAAPNATSGHFPPQQHPFNQHSPAYQAGPLGGNNFYSQTQQPQQNQSGYAPYQGGFANLGQFDVNQPNLVPGFDAAGATYPVHPSHSLVNHNTAQHLQPGQWHQQTGTPASYNASFHSQSLSPQPETFFPNRADSAQSEYQQPSTFLPTAQNEAAPKQESDLDSISTPPLQPSEPSDASPQKRAPFRIKLSRKVHEISAGGQQAQAQVQLQPDTTNMTRPSRAAAAAATAALHSNYGTPTSQANRKSSVKQQPGSEEDYEDVSRVQRYEPNDHYDDDNHETSVTVQSRRQHSSIPPGSFYTPHRAQSAKKNCKGKKGKQKAKPSEENEVDGRGDSRAGGSKGGGGDGSSSANRGTAPAPKQRKGRPVIHDQPTRRSSRLSSQPPSSQETGLSRLRSFSQPRNLPNPLLPIGPELIEFMQPDADEQDDDDEDAEAEDDAEGEQDANVIADIKNEVEEEEDDEHQEPEPVITKSSRGRVRIQRVQSMAESGDSDEEGDDEEEVRGSRRSSRRLKGNSLGGFVAADDQDEEEDDEGEYGSPARPATRSSGRLRRGNGGSNNRLAEMAAKKRAAANGRGRIGKRKVVDEEFEMEADETPEEEPVSGAEDDPLDIHSDEPEGSQGKSYSLRQRKKVNYSLVPAATSPPRDGFGRPIRNNRGRSANGAYEIDPAGSGAASGGGTGLPMPFPGRGKKGKEGWDALPSSMSGKDYARIFGDPVDSSDDELQNNALRKPGAPAALGGGAGAGGLLGAGGAVGAGGPPGGLTGSGGTDSFGRIKKSGDPLADVDPLGVDMNIDFDSVGGLDGHIQQLKEMVMLPLLYPEVFQRFKVTPPRGVLFHGPPGTGKTLVARALAASCSTDGQQVSFFMRKGADCLSKWVGEAERQLRLLFEEARASQPSIIFFDEIDGLAPVRSSKQDQIHASIVSTMLALMDGMDGRGQVVVIGATNRPDSVDPALRRPGRFDREFYFPLPSLDARKSIINIHTKKWEPPLDDDFKARLAEVTKGYGGADLRALCTEAALNAIQRRYPQIYSTTDRLLLDPGSIQVDAKDFMMSVNKIVPSSARASASAAAPLPERLAPLLGNVVANAISVLDRILPPVSKRNPLEEALWEDDTFAPQGLTSGLSAADKLAGDRGFGREMLLQSFEAQRVYRPRMLVYGDVGMGQGAVGAALLQHLEGYHVQSLDIGTLLGDSARTPEAAVIQLFVEAKRHKPSVLYIPGIVHWARSVSESVKTTFKALLDGLTDADPVMLLGVAEAPLEQLDDEVQSWFNFLDDDLVEIPRPDEESRREYFKEIFDHVIRPPTEFPDALPRRKRVLEVLEKAPPRPPRKLTQAELQQQADNDAKLLEHLKFRLGPVLSELRKKFKKFTRDVWDEYNLRELTHQFDWTREKGKITVELRYYRPGAHPAEIQANEDADDTNDMLETEADIAAKRGITAAQFMGTPTATVTEIETTEGPAEGAQDVAPAAEASAMGENGDVEMANGDSAPAVNGTNGISQGTDEGESSKTFPIAPASSQPDTNGASAIPTDPTLTSSSAADPIDLSRTTPPVPAPANGTITDDYVTRKMPIWTTNLEKMQKRLYYNGYLSCSSFMADIQKIVENAEQAAEVDQDRVFRAHQMRNLAIVLMDQYIDAGFREECDRMALRQEAREREAKEATEKAKQSAEEAAKKVAEGAKGERTSARIAGKEPEVGALEGSGGRGEKRMRSVSAQAPADTPAVEGAEQPAAAVTEEVSASTSTEANAGGEEEARKRARLASPPPTAQPEPEPHPPLIYNEPAYHRLKSHIITSTSSYNIDQLSRLRAACFNAIWSHRSDWNRDELIGRLIEIVAKSEAAVTRENKLRGVRGWSEGR